MLNSCLAQNRCPVHTCEHVCVYVRCPPPAAESSYSECLKQQQHIFGAGARVLQNHQNMLRGLNECGMLGILCI